VPHILNYNDLLNASSQVGSDVVISFVTNTHGSDETNSITLQNFNIADLEHMQINYGRIAGTDGDDVLFAPAGGAYVDARGGNDILNGSADRDDLDGGPGNDQLFGNDGDDNLRGGEGVDSIDGGNGQDQLDYRWTGENQGVVVNLALNQVINDGFGYQDSISSIENVQGSEFDDLITGDSQGNNLHGREGDDGIYGGDGDDWIEGDEGHDQLFGDNDDDVLTGEQGNDLLDGGAGLDRANYADWAGTFSGVTADLSNVQASAGGFSNVVVVNDGQGGTDYLRSIEDLEGGSGNDAFTGDAGENQLRGRAGNDMLAAAGIICPSMSGPTSIRASRWICPAILSAMMALAIRIRSSTSKRWPVRYLTIRSLATATIIICRAVMATIL
jgi:Ca2+-binding RTX toxin-like protein